MKIFPQQQTVFTVRGSWEALLRGRTGYLISGPRGNTVYYAERAAPELLFLPVFVALSLGFGLSPVEMVPWAMFLFPFVVVAAILTGLRRKTFLFYEYRNRLKPLFKAVQNNEMFSPAKRFNLIVNGSGEGLCTVVRIYNKAGIFFPTWEVRDAAGDTVLRAVFIPFNFGRDNYKLLAGQSDDIVGYISTDFFRRKYSIRFSGQQPEGIDDRIVLATLTLLFDSQRRSNG